MNYISIVNIFGMCIAHTYNEVSDTHKAQRKGV